MDYGERMNEPRLIWRLGRWIARRSDGAARLEWADGEMVLRLRGGRIVSVEGLDSGALAERLGCEPTGSSDLLREACSLSRKHGLPVTQTVGVAKELVQEGLLAWLMDSDRQLELVEGSPEPSDTANISITHALVELILSDTSGGAARQVLPDPRTPLRRCDRFLELYAPLRLSEEADLIVAKISGRRTAQEIAASSPHGEDEVNRLLAALVATGILEASPPAEPRPEAAEAVAVDLAEEDESERHRLRIPVIWIGAAAALLVVILVALGLVTSSDEPPATTTVDGATWSLVVDMGCEPEELQRVLKKAREHPELVRPVRADASGTAPCWRLVWGSFPTRQAAEAAVNDVPSLLRQEGFTPHAIQAPGEKGDLPPDTVE